MKKLAMSLLFISCFALIIGILPVSGQCLDIQQLIDGSAPGDIIQIPPGTYLVNLSFKGRGNPGRGGG